METEAELDKEEALKTDDGFSEKRLALKFNQAASSKAIVKSGNIFAPVKKAAQQTVFQAQKDEEI